MGKEKGIVGNPKKQNRRSFQEWLADAKTYQETYGNLLIPGDYVTPEGNRLGRWIERKRAQHNGVKSVNGYLYADEIEALESIGMVWKLEYRFPWKEWVRQAAAYYHTHGHLNVPKEYVQEEYSLGHWLIEQKQRYAAGRLSDQEIHDLENCGIRWKLHTSRDWEEWYAIAERYYETKGNLRVRADYVTEEGERLGKWIGTQRDCYHHRPGKRRLLPSEIERLERIGMIWSIAQERDAYWTRMLQYTRNYVSEYDRLPPRSQEKVITPEGFDLTNWVRNQQERYRRGLLNEERISALREAGVIERRSWKKRSKRKAMDILDRYEVSGTYDWENAGARIRGIRTLFRFSPDRVAKELHIEKQEYMDIESGAGNVPLQTIAKIASYYRVSLEYLVRGREAVSRPEYTRESMAILLMLHRSETGKRKKALKILRACLSEQ